MSSKQNCCFVIDPDAGYDWLLSTWFPDTGQYEVRLADTGEEAVILHDWLRMKMVRSGVPKLVNAGEWCAQSQLSVAISLPRRKGAR